jgi:hypothetical protein
MARRAQKDRTVLRVQVRFEMSRVAAVCLMDAYERVVPSTRRSTLSERGQDLPGRSERPRRAEGSE